MPPEPLPWDRRDFRKHERSGSDPRLGGGGFGGGSGPHRWRDQHHHPHAQPPHPPPHQQQQQQQRWYSDFRSSRLIPPGHGKQGGWHMYPDDAGHGFMPFGSRYGDRNLDDENCRPFGSRGDGRYFRNSRENRGCFSQKDWKAPSWESSGTPSGPGKPPSEVNNLRSIENSNSKSNHVSHPPPDSVSLSDQSQPLVKEKNDENNCTADGPPSSSQKLEKENCLGSIDWKPLKWTRSGSMSSRGSGVSHSNSPKSMGVDSSETVVELQSKNATPVQSPSADAAACVISIASVQSDETGSRKKPRLGWGEGLAKYEKKKVEGPEDCATKNELVHVNAETLQSHTIHMPEKSPGVASLSDCASPATPSSVACSSSPGIEEKESLKEANVDHDTANVSCLPSIMSQANYGGLTFNLENLELASIANLSALINELLQSDDPSSTDTGYERTTSMNKLLVWKVDILKALEMTESEIDSLETELKTLTGEPGSDCPHPAGSSSLPGVCLSEPCEELVAPSKLAVRPAPLHVSSGGMIVDNEPVAVEHELVVSKDEDIDSPGTATSRFVQVLPAGEEIFPSDTADFVEGSVNRDVNNSNNLDEKCSKSGLGHEENSGSVDNHILPGTATCGDLAVVSNVRSKVDNIYDSIISTNKDYANRALEELNKLLPAKQCPFDSFVMCCASSFQRDSSVVKEKFLRKKRFLQFKEKALTLKFKVFQHFWKEGRLVSLRKLRVKSQKKFDPNRNGLKKNRSAIRSRISSYAGCPQTVPVDEVIEYVNELLSELAFKPCRNTLKMPAMILDKETKMSRFISNNGLVEDAVAVEKERSMINPWTPGEKEIFLDKFAVFGKDFVTIASFLDHKTVADCIEFYYKNHKSECFEKAKKNPDFMKQRKSQSTTYLVASGKRWNRESNAASLDMLGAASEIAATVNEGMEIHQKCRSGFFVGASSSYRALRHDDAPLQRSNSLDMYSNERETAAADVLAGICGSLSSEAMSSCITSSVDPGDGYQDWRCPRVGSNVKRPLTPEVTQNVDDECSDESCGELDTTDWTDEEKSIFIHAVSSYGKDFVMISQCVRTKSVDQCKLFFSKARKCLGLDQIQPRVGTVSGDVNGGGSDIEDGCTAETGSVICNNGSECKMEEDLPDRDMELNHESDVLGSQNLRSDFKIKPEGNNGLGSLDSMAAQPVLKNSLSGGDDKPVIDSNGDSKEPSGADHPMLISSNAQSEGVEEEDNLRQPNRTGEAENKASVEVSGGHCGEKNQQEELLLPEENLETKTVEDRDANSSEVSDRSSAVSEMKSEPLIAGNVSHPAAVDACSKKADLETCSAEKCCSSSLQQNGHLSSVKSSTLFSVPIKYQKNANHNGLGAVGANEVGNTLPPQKIVRTGGCQQQQQQLLGHSLVNSVESSQILRGYPVSVQTMKDINGDVNYKKLVTLQNVPKQDGNSRADQRRELFLEKCNGSRQKSNVEAPFPSADQSLDKPSRNGDVKLFGKILTSSQQKPSSCVRLAAADNNNNNSQDHKADCHSVNPNLSSDQKVNFDCNNYVGSENIHVRSFGFWDGNRIQTGFAPLPDSALLLAKYPAAFSNCGIPTVKLDPAPLRGVCVFPSREQSSSNGLADYQVLRNRELQQQPFTIDMKPPQDMFSEMQRRNGFELVSGAVTQQARGMLGLNVVGRQDSGVSDPVAALKMHFAKSEQLSMMQGANVINEDHRWRSNGDLGR